MITLVLLFQLLCKINAIFSTYKSEKYPFSRDTHEISKSVELLCDRRVRSIFSGEFLNDNDSKRIPEKVFQHEPNASGEKYFEWDIGLMGICVIPENMGARRS